ncbi:hypothetical protein Taro_041906 [Colocasia esculenta]|uniref:Uncharacterized protein n=1 Tax=Colocasia esculenta TaxID=4460 RepID=A0A843WFJ5_COLES|nr:hypothetical protein [Colocasia esculenta]
MEVVLLALARQEVDVVFAPRAADVLVLECFGFVPSGALVHCVIPSVAPGACDSTMCCAMCLDREIRASFHDFSMLPSLVWYVWLVGDPGMEHPVGLPLCWCRDRGARCDTRRGVCSVGCDLIATCLPVPIRIAVATRVLVAIGFAVAMPFPITTGLLSRCRSPSRWYCDGLGGRDNTCVASGVSVVPVGVSASASGLACP